MTSAPDLRPSFKAALLIVLAIIVLDQITKVIATRALSYGVPLPVFPSFNLTLLHNTGAAFSLLASAPGWQRWLFSGLAAVASLYIAYLLRGASVVGWVYRGGLTLVLGGALGNLLDRLRLGYVVDFIQVFYGRWYFPAFNVADSAISLGAVLLVYASLFQSTVAAAPHVDR